MSLIKILIADDERISRQALRRALVKKYTIFEAEDGDRALEIAQKENPDIILLDINMPKKNGFEVLEKSTKLKLIPICIMMTAYGSERVAVEALKKGAWDYIAKPFQLDELRTLIRNASEQIHLKRENEKLKTDLQKKETKLLGQSEQMVEIRSLIQKVAQTDVTVLILGESGTGKDLTAQSIHEQSNRSNQPFIAINCGALPKDLIESELFGYKKGAFTGAIKDKKGMFELAHNGTLFLDEIGEMAQETQVKVLRAIEEKSITPLGGEVKVNSDFRIICATNTDLKKAIKEKKFREDLFYRLSVVELTIPPLRERVDDIPILINYFNQIFCNQYSKGNLTLTANLIEKAKKHRWPGNIRELKNLIENSVVLSDEKFDESIFLSKISDESKNEYNLNGRTFQDAKQEYLFPIEKALVEQALNSTNQNITKASKILGMKRQYLQQKIKQLNLLQE